MGIPALLEGIRGHNQVFPLTLPLTCELTY